MWHKDYPACVQCGTTDKRFMAKGLCSSCYAKSWKEANPGRDKFLKDRWYRHNVAGTPRQAMQREQYYYGGNRQIVLSRDGFKCTKCGGTDRLVVHHKDRSGRGVKHHNNDLANLVTLCRKCHVLEHRNELKQSRKPTPHCKNGHLRSEFGRHNGLQWVCRECAKLNTRKYRTNKRSS
jgi:5-methylcytosine-specific restriction endonuclease McrA